MIIDGNTQDVCIGMLQDRCSVLRLEAEAMPMMLSAGFNTPMSDGTTRRQCYVTSRK